jgi:outer membrane protein OmpA-like peptidoglycan-associated protein
MRTRFMILAVLSACATPNTGRVCTPSSSWGAPAYRCVATDAPAPVTEPEAVVAPPPPKAEVSQEKIDLKEKVEFDTDSATILDRSKTVLDDVVSVMKKHPEIAKIEIQGHTDGNGSHDHNVTLSAERAASVRSYFEQHGIDGKRMVSKGFGPDKPIAENTSEEGRAQNRRVEIHILQRK